LTYEDALSETEPERILFLAVPTDVFDSFFQRPFYQRLTERRGMKIIVFDPQQKIIVLWKS
jgi:XisH protein